MARHTLAKTTESRGEQDHQYLVLARPDWAVVDSGKSGSSRTVFAPTRLRWVRATRMVKQSDSRHHTTPPIRQWIVSRLSPSADRNIFAISDCVTKKRLHTSELGTGILVNRGVVRTPGSELTVHRTISPGTLSFHLPFSANFRRRRPCLMTGGSLSRYNCALCVACSRKCAMPQPPSGGLQSSVSSDMPLVICLTRNTPRSIRLMSRASCTSCRRTIGIEAVLGTLPEGGVRSERHGRFQDGETRRGSGGVNGSITAVWAQWYARRSMSADNTL